MGIPMMDYYKRYGDSKVGENFQISAITKCIENVRVGKF